MFVRISTCSAIFCSFIDDRPFIIETLGWVEKSQPSNRFNGTVFSLSLLFSYVSCVDVPGTSGAFKLRTIWFQPYVTQHNTRRISHTQISGHSSSSKTNASIYYYHFLIGHNSQIIVPHWPMYNRHPVKWLPVKKTESKKGK